MKSLIAVAVVMLLVSVGAMAQVPAPPNVDAWYEYILKWVMTPVIGPVIIGFVSSWLITQRWKMTFPAELSADQRRRKTQRTSFFCGAFPTLVLWPIGWILEGMDLRDIYLVSVSGFIAAVLVGSAAPFAYSIIMNRLYKLGWLNEHTWSGEARAAAKRENGTTSEGIKQE